LKLPKDIGVAQLVTVPTSKFKALSPNPSTERGRGREREREILKLYKGIKGEGQGSSCFTRSSQWTQAQKFEHKSEPRGHCHCAETAQGSSQGGRRET
jgi:hypothetical protein